ncbi:MAG: hypothetical protein HRU11_12170 [Parvularculaceae bacterium]|nr:hypothetical protein [Parvularculaceae bacterium]
MSSTLRLSGAPPTQFFRRNVPGALAGGSLTFLAAGTDTKLDTYSDPSRTASNENPLVLDADGVPESAIYLQTDQLYDIVAKNATGGVEWTEEQVDVDFIPGPIGTYGGLIVNSIADLRLQSTVSTGAVAQVLRYYTDQDGGGGFYQWDATSTATDDGGSVIQASGVATGRWLLVHDGKVTVRQFGARGDAVSDDHGPFLRALTFAENINQAGTFEVGVPPGAYLLDTDNGSLPVAEGVGLVGARSGFQVRFTDVELQATSLHVIGTANEVFALERGCRVEDFNVYYPQQGVTGTAATSGATTLGLDTNASDNNNAYNGDTVTITGGLGSGQVRTISSYDGPSKTATVSAPWDVQPDATSAYFITGANASMNTATPISYPYFMTAGDGGSGKSEISGLRVLNASRFFRSGRITPGQEVAGGAVYINDCYGMAFDNWITIENSAAFSTITNCACSAVIAPGDTEDSQKYMAQNLRLFTVNGDNDGLLIDEFQSFRAFSFLEHRSDNPSATGLAAGSTADTITLASNDAQADNFYNGATISITAGTGVGQVREVSDYDAATNVLTVSQAWTTQPDTTSGYRIGTVGNKPKINFARISNVMCDGVFLGYNNVHAEAAILSLQGSNCYFRLIDIDDADTARVGFDFTFNGGSGQSDKTVQFTNSRFRAASSDVFNVGDTPSGLDNLLLTGCTFYEWGLASGAPSGAAAIRVNRSECDVSLIGNDFNNDIGDAVALGSFKTARVMGNGAKNSDRGFVFGDGQRLVFIGNTAENTSSVGANVLGAVVNVEWFGNVLDEEPSVRVTTTPFFRSRTASSQSISAALVVLAMATEDFDDGGDYDNATYTFTAPKAGAYEFSVGVQNDGSGGGTLDVGDEVVVRVDASNRQHIKRVVAPVADANISADLTIIVDMDVGDIAQAKAQVVGTGTLVSNNSGSTNWFTGKFLG